MSPSAPIPSGRHSLAPHLVVHDAVSAIEFYRRAFGAEELFRMPAPGGRIMHAELKFGDSVLMLCDEFPEMGGSCRSPKSLGGTSVTLHLWCEDVDSVYERAVKHGAKATMPVQDMFWGDRYGKVTDPFGHDWSLATHLRDMTPEQMQEAAHQAFAEGAPG